MITLMKQIIELISDKQMAEGCKCNNQLLCLFVYRFSLTYNTEELTLIIKSQNNNGNEAFFCEFVYTYFSWGLRKTNSY